MNREYDPIYAGEGVDKCPICKSYLFVEFTREIINNIYGISIRCTWCDTHTGQYKHKQQAIEAWNNRKLFLGE